MESLLNRTFPEVDTATFNDYIVTAENEVEDHLGYSNTINGITTSSGILTQTVSHEKSRGHIDSYGNLMVVLKCPPIHLDANLNPLVTQLSINGGVYNIDLQITNGGTTGLTSILEVDNNYRSVFYPAQYVIAAISTITPTAKIAFTNLKSLKFWTDISYTGGYGDVPPAISKACAYLVADQLMVRYNVSQVEGFTQGSFQVQFQRNRGKTTRVNEEYISPYQAMAYKLLQPYVRVSW